MDALIAEMGEGGVLALIVTRIAEGENPWDIAKSCGMPWVVMRGWMEDDEKRMGQWELAKRCFADGLVYEGLKEVKDADVETVQVSKLKYDAYTKSAGKMSRREWGEEKDAGGGGGITVVVQRGGVVAIGENKSLGPTLQVMAPEIETIEGEVLDG